MRAKPHRSKGLDLKCIDGVWHVSGTIAGERIRKSLGTRDETTALQLKADYETRLWKRHQFGEEAVRTFEEAAVEYLQHGGKDGTGGDGKFIKPILAHFKGRRVGSITGAELRSMANTLYPGRAPATKNRQAIVPARAVIMYAHHLGWCGAISVEQFKVPKSKKHKPATREWLDKFMAEADRRKLPHLSCLVLFMHQTGTRISEAIRIVGKDLDLPARIVVLGKTKTDEWVTRYLTAELVARIAGLDAKDDERIFGYTDPKAVNRVMKRVAKDAGIEMLTTHSAGRHSFATNAINANAPIKDAMDAGGWKSARLFMETYVHSHEAGKNVASIFDRQTGPIDMNEASAKLPRRRNAQKS
ncbi:MAG TPA: tyrosine-type recombinase/integrase [Devosia sp.]|nr:tyrosine-type recombinase/integrase [Devosia sp.]